MHTSSSGPPVSVPLAEARVTTPQQRAAAPSDSVWSRAHRRLTLGLILIVISIAFEALAVATTLPATARELGDVGLYGWAFSAFMLANLVGITLAGDQADRHGPVPSLVVGVSSFAVGLLVAGCAPSMPVLIAGRAIQGFGAGFLYTLAYFIIGRAYPVALHPRMLALASAAWVIPGLSGPAVAGLLAEQLGWRWVFFGLAPSALLAALLILPALRRMPGAAATVRAERRSVAAGAVALGTGMVLGGLGTTSIVPLVALVGVGSCLTLVGLRRVLPSGTLRAAPGHGAAVALGGLLHIAFYGVDAFVPLALTAVRGQAAAMAGLALTAGSLGWTGGTMVQAHLASRWSRRRLAGLGLGVFGLGASTFAVGLLPAVPIVISIVAWGVTGVGMGLAYSTSTLVVLQEAPRGAEGSATAALQLASVLGIAVGTGIGGVMVVGMGTTAGAVQAGIHLQQWLMGGVVVLAAIVARRLPGRAHPSMTSNFEKP